jgi:formylglycine-generating enzyme required for sulfatase activity
MNTRALLGLVLLAQCWGCSDPETTGGDPADTGTVEDAGADGAEEVADAADGSDDDMGRDAADVEPDAAPEGCIEWVGEVFKFEASRPDATVDSHGLDGSAACSRSGVLPWVDVTWEEASAACASVGASLCAGPVWDAACKGEGGTRYPYGDAYDSDACNVLESPDGCLNACRAVPTGTYLACVSAAGAHDMSGNVGEWVADPRPFGDDVEYEVRGGSYFSADDATIQCRDGHTWRPPETRSPELGFRCCR